MRRPTAVLALTALLASGCAGSTPQATAAPTEAPKPPTAVPVPTPAANADVEQLEPDATPSPTASPTALPTTPPQTLEWATCGQMDCATLTAPVDHDEPEGPTIGIALARVAAADPSRRIGSLLLNPGGPGASGIEFLASFAGSAPRELVERFDLVSWDPRGVGETSGLRCNDRVAEQINTEVSTLDGIRDDLDRYFADIRRLGSTCLAEHPDLLDEVGTVETAHDLELIRAAVGDEKLTYLGFSYGTRIGAVYASLFPTQVRAMTLDGAFPPSLTSTELALNAADLENALSRIDRVCDLEPNCNVASPGLIEVFNDLRDTLDSNPVDSPLGLSDRSAFVGATLLAIYVPDAWEVYAQGLADARQGDLQLVRSMSDAWFSGDPGQFNDIYFGANIAIMCADRAYPRDLAQATIDAEAALRASPLLGDLLFGANCAGWPVAGEPLPEVNSVGTPTIVVVGSAHDPATPLRWAERLTAQLDDAVLVTYTGDGHTVVGNGNRCVDDAITSYLVSTEAPQPGVVCEPESGLLGLRLAEVDGGIQVREVAADSAAAESGLEFGDVIRRIDGEPARALDQTITTAGQVLTIEIDRDGTTIETTVVADRQAWMLPPPQAE